MVKEVASDPEFRDILSKNPNKLVVVDYTAVWCGPCRAIAPFVEDLAHIHPDVLFLKVDVDKAQDIAQKQRITAMPTFEFFKNGNSLTQFQGASKQNLQAYVEKLKSPDVVSATSVDLPKPPTGSSPQLMRFIINVVLLILVIFGALRFLDSMRSPKA